VTAENIAIWQPDPDGTGKPSLVRYTYRVLRCLTASLSKEFAKTHFAVFLTVTPVEEVESIGWMLIAIDYEGDQEETRNFNNKIVGQDIPVVESQRPELLPLDLQSELHLKSDRMSIAYRKWLKQLGVSLGTS
jgi:phenylpropionate dioxygenase-like ring-hydroxylating dioxygenase large terminal subunit